jgi:hypothetical protein
MKNFKFQSVDGVEQVMLNGRKSVCECGNCGAQMEKRMYFTGSCAYCGSSDLLTKVIADNKYYVINYDAKKGTANPSHYAAKGIKLGMFPPWIYIFIEAVALLILFIMSIDYIVQYDKEEYIEMVGYALWFSLVLIRVIIKQIKKILYCRAADNYSKYLAEYEAPFVNLKLLPSYFAKYQTYSPYPWSSTMRDHVPLDKKRKVVRELLRRKYLKNCSLEIHGNSLVLVLGKKYV